MASSAGSTTAITTPHTAAGTSRRAPLLEGDGDGAGVAAGPGEAPGADADARPAGVPAAGSGSARQACLVASLVHTCLCAKSASPVLLPSFSNASSASHWHAMSKQRCVCPNNDHPQQVATPPTAGRQGAMRSCHESGHPPVDVVVCSCKQQVVERPPRVAPGSGVSSGDVAADPVAGLAPGQRSGGLVPGRRRRAGPHFTVRVALAQRADW